MRDAIPGIRIEVDGLLRRLLGLAEEPPVPPGAHERLVEALEMLHDRETVHHHQPCPRIGVIHGSAKRDHSQVCIPGTRGAEAPEPHESG